MRRTSVLSIVAAVAVSAAAITGTASAVDQPKHVAKGKYSNVLMYDTATEKALMGSVYRTAPNQPQVQKVFRSLGARVTFHSRADTVETYSPGKGKRIQYLVGMNGMQLESTAVQDRAVAKLILKSGGSAFLRNYVAAASASARKSRVTSPAFLPQSARSEAFIADYLKALGYTNVRGGYLNQKEVRAVVGKWRESPARR